MQCISDIFVWHGENKRVLGFTPVHHDLLHLPVSHLSLSVFPELLVVDFFLPPIVFYTKVANHTLTHNLSPANIWPVGTGRFNGKVCICTDLRDRPAD